MTERDELGHICRWNRTLSHENAHLRRLVPELEQVVAEIRIQREAADVLFGSTLDQLLEASEPQRD
jgi:hypothetical protein